MGKYLRKTRAACDVGNMELSQPKGSTASASRARTRRAKATAFEAPDFEQAASTLSEPYIQLRSRLLHKQSPCSVSKHENNNNSNIEHCSNCEEFHQLKNSSSCSELEMNEFLSKAESQLQEKFSERYNFDFVNELPLTGRYEWVEVVP